MSADVLIVPGLGDSGPAHWQSHWQAACPRWRRVIQRDWDRPVREDWIDALERAVRQADRKLVLVGHSLACALVAHWAHTGSSEAVSGALLVAPSDVDSAKHTPDEVRCFAPTPLRRLPFRSVVVASSDDPYYDMARALHGLALGQPAGRDRPRRAYQQRLGSRDVANRPAPAGAAAWRGLTPNITHETKALPIVEDL